MANTTTKTEEKSTAIIGYEPALKVAVGHAKAYHKSSLSLAASVACAFLFGHYFASAKVKIDVIRKRLEEVIGDETGLKQGMINIHISTGKKLYDKLTTGEMFKETLAKLASCKNPADAPEIIIKWLSGFDYRGKDAKPGMKLDNLERLRVQFDMVTRSTTPAKPVQERIKTAITSALASEEITTKDKHTILHNTVAAVSNVRDKAFLIEEAASDLMSSPDLLETVIGKMQKMLIKAREAAAKGAEAGEKAGKAKAKAARKSRSAPAAEDAPVTNEAKDA